MSKYWSKNVLEEENIGDVDYGRSPVLTNFIKVNDRVWSKPLIFSNEEVIVGLWNGDILSISMNDEDHIYNWKIETEGPYYSAPIKVDNSSFIIANDRGVMRKITSKGEVIWQCEAEGAFHANPILVNNFIYAAAYDHNLYIINAVSGNIEKKKEFNKHVSEDIYSSPFVHKNQSVIFGTGNEIQCVDSNTLERLWCFETGGIVDATVAVDNNENKIYIGSEDEYFYCIDLISSKECWKFNAGKKINASAVVGEHYVYFGTIDGIVHCVDKSSGTLVWKKKICNGFYYTALTLISPQVLCFVTNDKCFAISSNDGSVLWILDGKEQGLHSPITLFNQKNVFIGSDNGFVFNYQFK